MQKITLILFTIIILISCNENPQKVSTGKSDIRTDTLTTINDGWTIDKLNKEYPYDNFDTILSNGYHLSFSYFQENKNDVIKKCLTLKRGEIIIDTLKVMGYAAINKNLGYIGADFKDYFAFVNSFGSGNPHYLSLLRKKDAKEIKSGYIINSNSYPELLVYEDKIDGKLKIFDFENMKDIDINNIIYDCFIWQLSEALKIKKVTKEEVFIECTNNEDNVIKYKYYR